MDWGVGEFCFRTSLQLDRRHHPETNLLHPFRKAPHPPEASGSGKGAKSMREHIWNIHHPPATRNHTLRHF